MFCLCKEILRATVQVWFIFLSIIFTLVRGGGEGGLNLIVKQVVTQTSVCRHSLEFVF